MEVVLEPNIMGARIKTFLDDLQWSEHMNDLALKQIKRGTSSSI